jgi:hypothetical protein
MANEEHLAILRQGVETWNAWRREQQVGRKSALDWLDRIDLREAKLSEADLGGADLSWTDLREADLTMADLSGAHLRWAKLRRVDLSNATLREADLREADLRGADLHKADLDTTDLGKADLRGADLSGADLDTTWLHGAKLRNANLWKARLDNTNLYGVDLTEANLQRAVLINTNLKKACLTGCRVYGMSAWDVRIEETTQTDIIITQDGQPKVTVDNLEMAQFVHLLLHNQKIRAVVDTLTSKVVLILGRFTPERKAVLDALREELRKRDYLPILFDFDVPAGRDITETVSLLAGMARFIVADLTDPSSLPKELEAIVPNLAVPVQPLLEGAGRPFAMFKDYWKYDWVLPVHRYEGLEPLLASMPAMVIGPAEAKVKALAERRRAIEAELAKPS